VIFNTIYALFLEYSGSSSISNAVVVTFNLRAGIAEDAAGVMSDETI
jgi:hypothetical protein